MIMMKMIMCLHVPTLSDNQIKELVVVIVYCIMVNKIMKVNDELTDEKNDVFDCACVVNSAGRA